MVRRLQFSDGACLVSFCAAALLNILALAPAHAAQKVGVAAAVNPDAFASGQVVNLGKSIFFNEQVNTSANGLVQVLLVDGSTFTVGPNSNLVIDKFVYDPAKGQGEMVATFSKGALRFVGGKLSKKAGGVTVKTPEGALAIRGGIAQLQVNVGGSKFLFDFGDQMQLQGNDGKTHTIFQPGNTIDVTGGSPFVRPTNASDIAFFLTQLTSKPGQSGGAGQGGGPSDGQTQSGMGGQGAGSNTPPPVGNNETQTEIFTVKIEDATSDEITQEIIEQIDNEPPPVLPLPVDSGNPIPPEQKFEVRILTAPDSFTSFLGSADQQEFPDYGSEYDWNSAPGARGILGSDNNPSVTADDFVTTARLVNGSLQGSVRLVENSYGACAAECGPATVLGPTKYFAFSFNQTNGVNAASGIIYEKQGSLKLVTDTFVGSQAFQPGFFAYQMYSVYPQEGQGGLDGPSSGTVNASVNFNDPLLIVGGKQYDLPSQGKLHNIALFTDPAQNQNGYVVPFASADFMPKGLGIPDPEATGPLPSVSNLLLLEKDSGETSQSVWMQTSFYIGPTGESGEQQSFVVVALGGVEDRNGFDALVGERRGGSQTRQGPLTEPSLEQASFAGGVATVAGGDGAHLMGSQGPNFVIGADSVGPDHEIFVDRPLQDNQHDPSSDHQHASYHIGMQAGAAQGVNQNDATLQGYATGMVESLTLGRANSIVSGSPGDVTFTFDRASNTLAASLRLYDQGQDGATSSYELGFGGIGVSGQSAFIDNQRFAAIENSGETNVYDNNGTAWSQSHSESWLASGDQLEVTSFFPAIFEETSPESGVRPFCQNCDFIKWGAWGTRVQFGSGAQAQYDDNVHMGWWVAGDVTKEADFAALSGKSADYQGHVIGNVANGDRNYIAAGDMAMHWDFGSKSGGWNVTNFDHHNFGGAISAQAATQGNQFGGFVSGGGLTGRVDGSFVNNGGDIARGAIGNFAVGGDGYRATGIFAGSTPGHYATPGGMNPSH